MSDGREKNRGKESGAVPPGGLLDEDTTGTGFSLEGHESKSFLIPGEGFGDPLVCKISECEGGRFELSFLNLSPAFVAMLTKTPIGDSGTFEFEKIVDRLRGQPIEVSVNSATSLPRKVSFTYRFEPGSISSLLRRVFSELNKDRSRLPAEFSATIVISLPACIHTPEGRTLSLKLEAGSKPGSSVLTIPAITTRDVRSMLKAVLAGKKIPVDGISLKNIERRRPQVLDLVVSGENRGMNSKVSLVPSDTPDILIAKVISAVCDQVGSTHNDDGWRVTISGLTTPSRPSPSKRERD